MILTPLPPVETGMTLPETHPALSDTGIAKLSGSGQDETGIAEIGVTTNTSDT